MTPGLITDVIGFALLGAVLLFSYFVTKKGKVLVAEMRGTAGDQRN